MGTRFEDRISWKSRLISAFDVIIRVPPLFLADSILNLTILKAIPWQYYDDGPAAEAHLGFGPKSLMTLLFLLAGGWRCITLV